MRKFLLSMVAIMCGLTATQAVARIDDDGLRAIDLSSYDSTSSPLSVLLPGPGAGIQIGDGELVLHNRGYVFLKDTPRGEARYQFDWSWDAAAGTDPVAYADHLLVLLRSSGMVKKERAYETEDGLRVRIDAGYGKARLEKVLGGVTELIVEKDLDLRDEDGGPAVPPGKWMKVLIRDTGNRVQLRVGNVLILEGTYNPDSCLGTKFGLANREVVGGPHQSRIRNLTYQIKTPDTVNQEVFEDVDANVVPEQELSGQNNNSERDDE